MKLIIIQDTMSNLTTLKLDVSRNFLVLILNNIYNVKLK
jgi:hypothetical protein